jgi:hypothetical protein
VRSQSNCDPDLSSSTLAAILRGAPLGGESVRAFFAFFKLGRRKRTEVVKVVIGIDPDRV